MGERGWGEGQRRPATGTSRGAGAFAVSAIRTSVAFVGLLRHGGRFGMVPLAAGALLFFACAKKSRQKKHTPAVRPPLRGGCAVPAGIFGRGILPRPKTAHILVRRPAGFTRRDCRT